MEKKRVLVTGASGYIGRHLVEELLNLGHIVLAADIRFDDIDERAIKITTPIFTDDENIYSKLQSPDVCIHMAWRDGFKHDSDKHMEDLSNHYIFIKNMLAGGLKHIVAMGSMHEVGYWEGAIDENTPTNPLSLYGIAKNSLRQAVALLSKKYEADYQWIRGYYIVGDDLNNHSIFTKIRQMEANGDKVFPFTSGKNMYDFTDINELARQISYTSLQNKITGVVNCCSGNPISLANKVEEFISENNYIIRPNYGQFPDRPYDSPGVWGDATKIKAIMGSTN